MYKEKETPFKAMSLIQVPHVYEAILIFYYLITTACFLEKVIERERENSERIKLTC